MIQMRENRYNDIRESIVNRSSETSTTTSADSDRLKSQNSNSRPEVNPDPRANQADEYLDDEYNSWS